MREILFHGKRKDNGEWLEGSLLFYPDVNRAFMSLGRFYKTGDFFEIDKKTIGQYTGLADKNGKKIFEGDILDCGDRIVYVSWHQGCGTWDCNFLRYKGELCSNGIENSEWKYRATVIGNIYDNPELL